MKRGEHDAHRAFEESTLHPDDIKYPIKGIFDGTRVRVGCNGDCADQGDCTCSHSAWRAPRQPRKPEPRTPHLPLWTRVKMATQHRLKVGLSDPVTDFLVCALVVFGVGAGLTAVALLAFFR